MGCAAQCAFPAPLCALYTRQASPAAAAQPGKAMRAARGGMSQVTQSDALPAAVISIHNNSSGDPGSEGQRSRLTLRGGGQLKAAFLWMPSCPLRNSSPERDGKPWNRDWGSDCMISCRRDIENRACQALICL